MAQKIYYMDVINILAPLNMFAGGLTIVAQLVTPCSRPSVASLLALASELFLGSLAGLLIVFLLLYGFWDTDIISDGPKPARCCGRTWGRHSLVVAQVVTVGFMMIAAFFVLGVAIVVVGNHWARGFGMGLVFLVFVGAVLVGIMIGRNKYVRVPGSLPGPPDPVPIHDVQRDLTKGQGVALAWLILLELIIVAILLGLGIWQATDPSVGMCSASSTSLQWPSATIAVSDINPQTNPLVTFTDVDTIVSITLTDIDLSFSRSGGFPTRYSSATVTTSLSSTVSVAFIRTVSVQPEASQSPVSSYSTFSPPFSKSTPPLSHTVFQTPRSFVTSTITSVISCTTKGFDDEGNKKARYNLFF